MKLNYTYRDSCWLFGDYFGKQARFIRHQAKPGIHTYGDMMGADDDHLGVDVEVHIEEDGTRSFTGYLRTHWDKKKALRFNDIMQLMTLLSWNDPDLTNWYPVEKYKGKYRMIMEKDFIKKGMVPNGVVSQMLGF